MRRDPVAGPKSASPVDFAKPFSAGEDSEFGLLAGLGWVRLGWLTGGPYIYIYGPGERSARCLWSLPKPHSLGTFFMGDRLGERSDGMFLSPLRFGGYFDTMPGVTAKC